MTDGDAAAAPAPDDYGVPLGSEDVAFRDEVRSFLARELSPEIVGAGRRTDAERVELIREWQRRLHRAGLAAVSWPIEHGGRGAGVVQQLVFNAELARHRAPEPINRSAVNQLGPTIIQWGDDAQRAHYLPRILSGDDVWCQGFSEPDAGSDLASLRTRAVVGDDGFVVTGQKIWTSRAQYADWIYILVRTDPDAPKHEGISFLLVDLRTPGIEVRPIRQITGAAEFNEVFFDEVPVPRANLVGPLHGGWRVADSTLGYERVGQSRTHRIERRLSIVLGLATDPAPDGSCAMDDPLVRDRVVRFAAQVEALRQIAAQATAAGVRGVDPGPEASVAKLLTSEVDQAMAGFGLDLAGPAGVLQRGSPGAAKGGNVALSYLLMRAATLGAGTSEIQRNVIGEKLLGLPVTTDGDAFLELARAAEHLAELRETVDDLLDKEWSPERSRDLLDADGATWAAELWARLRDLGWADMLVDGTVADLCVAAEAVGASTAPIPLVTAAVARWAIGSVEDDTAITAVVPGIFVAARKGGGVAISGRQGFVPYADVAEHFLVHARDDHDIDVLVLLDPETAGIERTALRPLDVMPSATVELHAVHVPPEAVLATGTAAGTLAHEAGLRLTLGWTAELTGVAAAANAAAVEYARERIAFGRPIGAFQAVKHRLVDQRAAIEVSRALVGRAAMALDSGAPDRTALVALAGFWAGDALRAVPEGAIQVFGGIGYTWEHVAHVYLRRAAVLVALLGDHSAHRDVAAEWLRGR